MLVNQGINLLYLENGNMCFTRKQWSDMFGVVDITPLPDTLSGSRLVSFIENERRHAVINGQVKMFYGFYNSRLNGNFSKS